MEINYTINRYWKDWAGLVYLFICIIDFFVAPLVWNLKMEDFCKEEQSQGRICNVNRWEPHTLQMGGMFHIAFAGILGVATWKKKEENETSWKD